MRSQQFLCGAVELFENVGSLRRRTERGDRARYQCGTAGRQVADDEKMIGMMIKICLSLIGCEQRVYWRKMTSAHQKASMTYYMTDRRATESRKEGHFVPMGRAHVYERNGKTKLAQRIYGRLSDENERR